MGEWWGGRAKLVMGGRSGVGRGGGGGGRGESDESGDVDSVGEGERPASKMPRTLSSMSFKSPPFNCGSSDHISSLGSDVDCGGRCARPRLRGLSATYTFRISRVIESRIESRIICVYVGFINNTLKVQLE